MTKDNSINSNLAVNNTESVDGVNTLGVVDSKV